MLPWECNGSRQINGALEDMLCETLLWTNVLRCSPSKQTEKQTPFEPIKWLSTDKNIPAISVKEHPHVQHRLKVSKCHEQKYVLLPFSAFWKKGFQILLVPVYTPLLISHLTKIQQFQHGIVDILIWHWFSSPVSPSALPFADTIFQSLTEKILTFL